MKSTKDSMIYYTHVHTNHWSIYLAATKKGLSFLSSNNTNFVDMSNWLKKKRPKAKFKEESVHLSKYTDQLIDYLNGNRTIFNLQTDLIGTSFQKSVWEELKKIPFGETRSYSEIANNIDRPNSVRAVATAIGANPILIVVPCHRVINKNGKLGGYRGGIPMKKRLLELENK